MKLIATLLAGASLLCALHMLFAASAWPRWLERVMQGPGGIAVEPRARKAARGTYIALAVLGYGLLGYLGTSSAFQFIPTKFGGFVDGEWMSLRETFAMIVAPVVGVGVPMSLTKLAGFNAAEARRAEAAERRRLDPDA